MPTHASRDTSTGAIFEQIAHLKMNSNYINITKNNLYKYLTSKNINWETFLSRKLLPDEAYFNEQTKELLIYEKKFQQTEGSVDEKPQTCAFKIYEFRKIGAALGATTVKYTYIFNDWFKQPKYKDMLDYIKSVDGCDYIFWGNNSSI
jgi:hypothetical protein